MQFFSIIHNNIVIVSKSGPDGAHFHCVMDPRVERS